MSDSVKTFEKRAAKVVAWVLSATLVLLVALVVVAARSCTAALDAETQRRATERAEFMKRCEASGRKAFDCELLWNEQGVLR